MIAALPIDVWQRAAAFARASHGRPSSQTYGDGSYFTAHVVPVALVVAVHDGSNRQIAAALIHDTVEDTEATLDDVLLWFGPDVAAIVAVLTDGKGNRKVRKAAMIERLLANTDAAREALPVKLADLLVNGTTSRANNPGLYQMYCKEYPTFREALWMLPMPSRTRDLWARLDAVMVYDDEETF